MSIIRHDINNKKNINIFKNNRIINEIVDHCCSEKFVSKNSFVLHRQNVAFKHYHKCGVQTLPQMWRSNTTTNLAFKHYHKSGVQTLPQMWRSNTTTNLAWHNSESKCQLQIKFCTSAYFHETLCLKIN